MILTDQPLLPAKAARRNDEPRPSEGSISMGNCKTDGISVDSTRIAEARAVDFGEVPVDLTEPY
jgi:hypothetical protein